MTDESISRIELFALYHDLCEMWQRAVRLNEKFLANLLELSLLELRDRLGANLPMPDHPLAQDSETENRSTRDRRG